MATFPQYLTDLLFADASAAAQVAQEIASPEQWHELLALSFKWRVTPQLWQRLQSLKIALPGGIRSEFGKLCRVIAVQSTTAAHRSLRVMQALGAAGIEAVAFKGIGVMAGLYPKPSDRMVGDVDILIAPEDLEGAIVALIAIDFTPLLPGELTDYLDYLHHRTRSDNLFLILKDRSGFEIDLHWGLKATAGVEFSVPNILSRAVLSPLLHGSIPVASPVDAMLLSVHHSVRDDLAPASAIKDLCDLHQWWGHRDRWQLDTVIQQAKTTGLLSPLIALWKTLGDRDHTHPIHLELTHIQSQLAPQTWTEAQALQRLLALQLTGERLNRDLVNGLNWPTIQRFIRRRIQKGNTLSFDKSLWGIHHGKTFNVNKVRSLLRTLRGLNSDKLNAYKALSKLQDR